MQMGHSLTCHLHLCNSLYLETIPDTNSAVHDDFFPIENKPSELSALIGGDLGCHLSIMFLQTSQSHPLHFPPWKDFCYSHRCKRKILTWNRGRLLFWHVLADHNKTIALFLDTKNPFLKHPPSTFDCDTISHLFRVDALQFPIHGTSHVISLDPTTHLSSGGQERPRVFRGVLFGDQQHFSISTLQLRVNSCEPHPATLHRYDMFFHQP